MKEIYDSMLSVPDVAAVSAAMAVLDNHIAALNARDGAALVATLHFPHYRLTLDCFQAQRPLGRTSKIQLRGMIEEKSKVEMR